jgi:hypothetical protein
LVPLSCYGSSLWVRYEWLIGATARQIVSNPKSQVQ